MRRDRLAGWTVVLDLAYLFAFLLFAPYVLYRVFATEKYREGLPQRMGRRLPKRSGRRPCLWVHGVSVGEVMGARAFLREAASALPDWDLAVSTTTKTGQAMARRHLAGTIPYVFYFPFDVSWAVRSAFDAIRPDGIVLMELEIWPGFLAEASRRGIPVYLVNGRISARSFRGYKRGLGLIGRFLEPVRVWLVQTEEYAERVRALGVPAELVHVTGSMKHDNLPAAGDPVAARANLAAFGIPSTGQVLLAASTHETEEDRLGEAYARLRARFPELRLVVVPRHPERGESVVRALARHGIEAARWSEGPRTGCPAGALVVDAIGVLLDLFPAATAVFVGGSWIDHGGQNVLEPASQGRPIFIGPSVYNFAPEVERLASAGALEIVDGPDRLAARLEDLLATPERLDAMGLSGRRVVDGLSGASKRNLDLVMQTGLGPNQRR